MPQASTSALQSRRTPRLYSIPSRALLFACCAGGTRGYLAPILSFSRGTYFPWSIYTAATTTCPWASSKTTRGTVALLSVCRAAVLLHGLVGLSGICGVSAKHSLSLKMSENSTAVAGSGSISTKGPTETMKGSDSFPTVTLDADAVQKFAEIEVRWAGDDESSEPTVLIRGRRAAKYHKDAARPTMELLHEAGAKATVTGGGRIKHSSDRRSIFIYGYSMQFGPANLGRVADLCRDAYPDYNVTWSEGGY